MLVAPGVVVIWSGGRPRIATRRIEGALSIDRDLVDDPELLPDHAAVEVVRGNLEISARAGAIEVNGRTIAGARTFDGSSPPLFVAAGSSVIAVVGDVTQYEDVTIDDTGAITGSTLAAALRAVDDAANAEDHLSLRGPDEVTRQLAIRYADKLGAHAWFRPSGDQHLDHFLSTRRNVRTVIIELSRPLFEHDVRAITTLLETDMRFVVVRRDDQYVGWLPQPLAETTLDVRPGFEERAVSIFQAAAHHLDARLVAGLLYRAQHMPEERWVRLCQLAIEEADTGVRPDLDLILRHQI